MAIFTNPATVLHVDTKPYISLSDYNNAPTAVDTSELIPGATTAANQYELARVIKRASGWADRICKQTLVATSDIETGDGLYVRSDGTVMMPLSFWPVLEVDTCKVGPIPSALTAVTDTANLRMRGRRVLVIPVAGLTSGGTASSISFAGPLQPGHRCYCQVGYVNGWPHTTLAANALANDTSITVTTSLPAAAAGRSLIIVDGSKEETVTVAATFTGGTVVALAAGLLNAHTVPAAPDSIIVTALPDDPRQAVISLTSQLIKSRGAESMELANIESEPTKTLASSSGGFEDLAIAEDLLHWFGRDA
ncbi:MAG: hypothetical protein ACYDA6_00140 [Solirubrobacteraceae bacterium]